MGETLDLRAIAVYVRREGVHAFVTHTGGNVATLFAGGLTGADGDPCIAAGPGVWSDSPYAWRADFGAGLTDDGEHNAIASWVTNRPLATEGDWADIIVGMVRAHTHDVHWKHPADGLAACATADPDPRLTTDPAAITCAACAEID